MNALRDLGEIRCLVGVLQQAQTYDGRADPHPSTRFGFATGVQIPFKYSIKSFLLASLSCKLNWVS
jgi:hypothetical protein